MEQDGGYTAKQVTDVNMVTFAKRRIRAFACPCGHTYTKPYPALPKWDGGPIEDDEPYHIPGSRLTRSFRAAAVAPRSRTVNPRVLKLDSAADFPPLSLSPQSLIATPASTPSSLSPLLTTPAISSNPKPRRAAAKEDPNRININDLPKEILLV
jgi:hypothetical protein